MAAPMCVSTSAIFSMLLGSCSTLTSISPCALEQDWKEVAVCAAQYTARVGKFSVC